MKENTKEHRFLMMITRLNLLTNLLQSRLAFPLIYPFNTTALNNEKNLEMYIHKLKKNGDFNEEAFMKSLSFITPSIIALTKLVPILKSGFSLCNAAKISNRSSYIHRKNLKNILNSSQKKLHLLKPQTWRLLKPGEEMNTKHLKWRK